MSWKDWLRFVRDAFLFVVVYGGLAIGFGYCLMQLPRNCREIAPQHIQCE